MSDSQKTVRFGVAGLGGFSSSVRDLLMRCESEPDPACGQVKIALVAGCDPNLSCLEEAAGRYRAHGARLFESYEAMLCDAEIDAVWLPVPIDLHRRFSEEAFRAGKAVMTEKPMAGCVDDVDAMIRSRDESGLPGGVAYQFIGEPSTMPMKRRLLEGAIGRITRASVYGCWPRDDDYYGRSDWVGSMRCRGSWVLDGPAANAMSHFLNQGLFLLGESDGGSAMPVLIEAEQYRTRSIENNDTIGMRIHLANDVVLTGLFTHACALADGPVIEIEGTAGRFRWSMSGGGRMTTCEGVVIDEWSNGVDDEGQRRMAFGFAQSLVDANLEGSQTWSTFEGARSQVLAINGASEATGVYDVPGNRYTVIDRGVRAIDGINEVIRRCAREHKLFHELGVYDWTRAAGEKDLRGYEHFSGPVGGGMAGD